MIHFTMICVLTAAIYAMIRGFDIRLVLMMSAVVIGVSVGQPLQILDHFLTMMGDEKVIGPICSAMGFSFVIRLTGCDQKMVRLLLHPIQNFRFALVPAGIIAGFLTNITITSQTAAAAALGPILIPLMTGSGYSPLIAGVTLLLGCSVGGAILNPGEADVVAIQSALNLAPATIIEKTFLPLIFTVFLITALATCFYRKPTLPLTSSTEPASQITQAWHALIPPLPLFFMFLLQPRFALFPALVTRYPTGVPISHVMLTCLALVICIFPKKINSIVKSFFEGIGSGYVQVITLIVTASTFIKAVELTGMMDSLLKFIQEKNHLSTTLAAALPFGMAVLSGSGTAPSVSFSKAILPGLSATDPDYALMLGILAEITSSLGRTISPVAAIVVFTSTLCGITPIDLTKAAVRAVIPAFLMVGIIFAIYLI